MTSKMEKSDVSCEPMDIDLSSQSLTVMDISAVNDVTRTSIRSTVTLADQDFNSKSSSGKESIVKKFHIKMKRSPRNSKNTLFKILIALTVLIACITYQMYGFKCSEQLNLDNLKATLSSRLYGQKTAINVILNTLDAKATSKILFFCGGTGVGKTLTSSLILDTLDPGSNVYHYTMPTFRTVFHTDLMYGLIMCKMSVFILDDLTINDMDVKEQITSLIEKSESLFKNITVILIFNCDKRCENLENSYDKSLKKILFEKFSDVKALKSFVQFEPLLEEHLIKCIRQELGDRQLNYLDFKKVLKKFNVSVDGCKGVHSKMKYLIPV